MSKNVSTSKDALRKRLKRFTTKYAYVLDEAEFAHDLERGVTTYTITGAGISKRVELSALFEKHGFVPAFLEAGAAPVEGATAPEAAPVEEPTPEAVPAHSKRAAKDKPRSKPEAAPTGYAPRPGTKLADLFARLVTQAGVSLAEGMALTGWTDPHYVRSSSFLLSRRTGLGIECVRSKEENGARYRLLPRE